MENDLGQMIEAMSSCVQRYGYGEIGICDIQSGFQIQNMTAILREHLEAALDEEIMVTAVPVRRAAEGIRLRFTAVDRTAAQ